tara:strand:- start:132232 stop:133791 length:1560 start_codon:yes stop_codon:yes gene_type:complete
MNFILKISPAFLKKFDQYLRQNQAWLWSTKIHLNLYFTLLLSLIFILLGLVYSTSPKDPISTEDQNFFFGILFIPATILLGYFVYSMSIYNPDKKAGYRFRYQEFFVLIIYYFTFSLPLLIPYPSSWILSHRVAQLEEVDILEKQAEVFELGAYFFPSKKSNYMYYPNDSIFLEKLDGENYRKSPEKDYYEQIRIQNRAWQEMRDSIFNHKGVFKNERPKLYFEDYLGSYDLHSYAGSSFYPSYMGGFNFENDESFKRRKKEIVLQNDNKLAKKYIEQFAEIIKTYSYVEEVNMEQVFADYLQNNYFSSYSQRQLKTAIAKTGFNIYQIRKTQLKRIRSWNLDIYKGLALCLFCITLIFQVFKNSHWKQLLRSILFIGLFYTVVLVIDASSNFNSHLILSISLIFSLILSILSIKGFKLKKFSTFYVQTNIFLNFISPFLPILFLAYLDVIHDFFYWPMFDEYKETNNLGDYIYGTAHLHIRNLYFNIAFWLGIMSYVFFWNSYLKSLYLRYWSLPKNS